ncbi:MAG: lytic transglycosylase domain-containing protein [Rhodocyclaceae bacterium]|nr:lytic transglycosylase domain-containing protein [Rhodocyclaceae bacterium]
MDDCVREAATHYGVDVRLVRAILRVEGGRVGLRKANANGTYDLGPMQINTLWLPRLRALGVDESRLVWDYCANVAVGAWILAREMKSADAAPNTPEFWQSVGRYHSRTPRHNARYAVNVWHHAMQAEALRAQGAPRLGAAPD